MRLGPYELDQIYTGDARELAKAIPDESVDLLFLDPPYNLGKNYGSSDDSLSQDAFCQFVESFMPHALRTSRTLLITCGIANLQVYLRYSPKWVIAWHKPFGVSHSPVGFNNWEPILFWGKWTRNHYSDYILAPLHLDDKSIGYHECPKPIYLLSALIERYSMPGDVVSDWFVGSGTSAVAAKRLGRSWLGFEIDPDTAERARQRVQNTQPPLLIPEPEQLQIEAMTCPSQ